MTVYEIIQAMGKAHYCRVAGKGYADLMSFNLKEKTVHNGEFFFMKNGKIILQTIILSDGQVFEVTRDTRLLPDELLECNFKEKLEELYMQYYLSRPSKRSIYSKSNFIAKEVDNMTTKELANGKDRMEAKYELEAFVLLSSLVRDIPRELGMEEGQFFWRSDKSKLRLYKEWIQW